MKFLRLLIILFIGFFPVAAFSSVVVEKVGFDVKENIEISLSQKSTFKTYILQNPNRIVVDIENATLKSDAITKKLPKFAKNIRNSANKNNVRIVFDLKQKTNIQSAGFYKKKGAKNGKIIIKIMPEILYIFKGGSKSAPIKSVTIRKNDVPTYRKKTPIIVIDAGHGGKDPGTIGNYARTKEKNITLSYAKELAKQLQRNNKYKVYLTRDSDKFIPLKQRVAKARRVKADLFISLHANSAGNRDTKGFSIYTLSEKSSDKQAELLAQKENRADIISGINFNGASGDILKTLIDLSQRSSMNHSSRFANIAIKSVQRNRVEVLQNTHRFAGFVVLTAPDMVSVLIELGYLSNKEEEKDLNNHLHKRKIIKGLVDSINEYFKFK